MQGKNKLFEDDLSLWNSFLLGNEKAYAYIYQQHVQHLFSYGASFTTDRELVKDCIQIIFIRIHQNRQQLGKTDNIRLYLLAALKNALLNAFKKQNTYQQYINAVEQEETSGTIEEEWVSRETETNLQNQVAALKAVLTRRQQEIIHYRFVDDLSIEEISKLLDINYQSVANIIQRSLKKMRSFYLKSEYKR